MRLAASRPRLKEEGAGNDASGRPRSGISFFSVASKDDLSAVAEEAEPDLTKPLETVA